MPGTHHQDSHTASHTPRKTRRDFLQLFSLGIIAGMAATMAAAAFRFLRPISSQAADAKWLDVMPIEQIKGDKPIMRSISVEHHAGWSSTLEEYFIYILPQNHNQVLSAVCPHEGCNVTWHDESGKFACPCHDSNFTADGSRLNGPARRGLDPLPAREQNGILQVRYQSFMNNTSERIVQES